jgi:hypothetical protein
LCARNVQRIHGQPTTGSVPRIVCRVRPPPRPTRSPRSLDVVHTFKTSSASGFGNAGHLQPRLPLQLDHSPHSLYRYCTLTRGPLTCCLSPGVLCTSLSVTFGEGEREREGRGEGGQGDSEGEGGRCRAQARAARPRSDQMDSEPRLGTSHTGMGLSRSTPACPRNRSQRR